MILYLIHDLQKNSYSHPLVGPDLGTVNQSLLQLNPENLSDLNVIVLDTLETLDDLKSLRVVKTEKKPTRYNIKVAKNKLLKSLSPSKTISTRSKKITKKKPQSLTK